MTILISSGTEEKLRQRAEREGQDVNALADLLLSLALKEGQAPSEEGFETVSLESGTLADFLQGYVGVLHSGEHVAGGARMSDRTGKAFAEGMVRKRQDGRF